MNLLRHFCASCVVLSLIALAFSNAAAPGGVACGQDDDSRKEYRQAVEQLKRKDLSAKDRSAALNTLFEGLHYSEHFEWILQALQAPVRKNPHAIDELLPRLAEFLKHARENHNESRVCSLLDLLLVVGHGPPEVIAELESIYQTPGAGSFAAPSAAALLLTIDPNRDDLIQWIGDRLQNKHSPERVTAVSALGAAGKRVAPIVPKLLPLLDDPKVHVRVAAAGAMWEISPRTGDVVRVLQWSLSVPPVHMEVTRPTGISASGLNHHQAALGHLWRMGHAAQPAAYDVARLLKDPEDTTRWAAAHALGAIGARTPAILKALEEATRDEHKGVAAAAAEALKTLKEQKINDE